MPENALKLWCNIRMSKPDGVGDFVLNHNAFGLVDHTTLEAHDLHVQRH